MACLLQECLVKKRRKRKKQRKQRITSFYLFDIIEGIIDKELCSKQLDEAFNKFVSIKDVSYGDSVYRNDVEILPYFNEPVRLYNHLTSNVNPYPLAGLNMEIKPFWEKTYIKGLYEV